MVRDRIVRTKLQEIKENLTIVKKNLPETYEKFSKMGLVKDGIYKKIEFCIQNVIDICSILNADLELGLPADETAIIENITRHGIIDQNLSEKLKLMKGFRNILVHRYGNIHDKQAFTVINDNLGDFNQFIKEITHFLNENTVV
ncbi:MAG: DUF86 domain-containing protein [Candidatus Korarchaeota archaeon]|nr:DUF86 domain-containing protein [Candidatus Korarchaeota archaeon]NIU85542.1 DUF86 domain-containing protein [Candidatus Thorarchaeota archaeon]NIW15653.1 DUF86 domain-containing protein [Candidatus Thorarchaeota archaeon]NIW53583.1 DUF86 domain-containing protein [Candidatus Korarchaeota archaeon]